MKIHRKKLDELLADYDIIYKEVDGTIVIESVDSRSFTGTEHLVNDLAELDADFDMKKENDVNIIVSIPFCESHAPC